MNWEIIYYNARVQKSINKWPVGIRAFYARVTERMLAFGPNLGMPFTRSMGNGLFEIRAKGKEGIARAFFCTVINNKIVILHVYIKKTQKTPQKEITMARKRMADVQKNW